MTLTWAQRREELLGDCIVSPDVFNPMIDRLAAFVVPYRQALETEAAQRNLHTTWKVSGGPYAGSNSSKMSSHLRPRANSEATNRKSPDHASRTIV
jgi:hypothetical protein